jgi:hypothetical protein
MTTKYLKALGLAVLACPALALANAANFAGSWLLDREQSRNLPPHRQSIARHHLAITQDEKAMTVAIAIESSRAEIPPYHQTYTYQLNGQEVAGESEILTPNGLRKIPTSFQAEPQPDGTLKITITRTLTRRDETFKVQMRERWQLSPDGRTITIHLDEDLPRGGNHESDLVFVKQG